MIPISIVIHISLFYNLILRDVSQLWTEDVWWCWFLTLYIFMCGTVLKKQWRYKRIWLTIADILDWMLSTNKFMVECKDNFKGEKIIHSNLFKFSSSTINHISSIIYTNSFKSFYSSYNLLPSSSLSFGNKFSSSLGPILVKTCSFSYKTLSSSLDASSSSIFIILLLITL